MQLQETLIPFSEGIREEARVNHSNLFGSWNRSDAKWIIYHQPDDRDRRDGRAQSEGS